MKGRELITRLRSTALDSRALQPVLPILIAFSAICLTTVVLLAVDSILGAKALVFVYLLPTIAMAMHYGSTVAVLTSFASSLAAAYFFFPPKFSFYIADAARSARAAGQAAHHRNPGHRHALDLEPLDCRLCAAAARTRLDRGPNCHDRGSLGRWAHRTLCRDRGRVRSTQGRCHSHVGSCGRCGKIGHLGHPDRVHAGAGPGSCRRGYEPRATGWQRHRALGPIHGACRQAARAVARDYSLFAPVGGHV